MNQRQYVTHRSGLMSPTFVAAGIVCLGLAGGALLLHSTGAIDLPFLSREDGDAKPRLNTSGKTAVPICVRPIPAYDRVQRQHLLHPSTQHIAVVWMRPENIPEGAAKGAGQILGRVMRWDKQAGQIFMMHEFYPPGTRPGPTAGIPPGKRAMRLRAAEVPGLHGLNQGDSFDIVMTLEIEIEEPRRTSARRTGLEVDGPYAPLLEADNAAAEEAPRVIRRRAEVRVVVRGGIVVQPIRQRQEVAEQASLLRGSSLQRTSVEEMVIAVDPDEVAALHQARAIGARLQVAMRSGQVPEEGTEVPEGEIPEIVIELEEEQGEDGEKARPRSRVRLVEVIRGGKKSLMAVPICRDDQDAPDKDAPDRDAPDEDAPDKDAPDEDAPDKDGED